MSIWNISCNTPGQVKIDEGVEPDPTYWNKVTYRFHAREPMEFPGKGRYLITAIKHVPGEYYIYGVPLKEGWTYY